MEQYTSGGGFEKATNTSDEWTKIKIILQVIAEHGILQ